MKSVAAFGEIMLRLSPPGRERFFQSPGFLTYFGGGEANVAASLAQFGHPTRFITVLPKNEIASAAVRELRMLGVDTGAIVRKGGRLGLYFVETGANQKPTQVIYDRDHSAVAEAKPGDIDWGAALKGMDWFHIAGITPALSRSAADLSLEAVRAANAAGLTVSVDLNYRSKLWNYGVSAPEVMREIFRFADVGIANEEEFQQSLGLGTELPPPSERLDRGVYERLTAEVMAQYPRLSKVAVTLRENTSADRNGWSAVLRTKTEFVSGARYDITDIVDRIGGGDAFAAGLIHGFDAFRTDGEALDFALAASCLKHSIPGDFNLVSEREVLALMKGGGSGRVLR
jgi:2-dehydro-3-deoxygluconokinase